MLRILDRTLTRYMREPSSPAKAARAIIVSTIVATTLGAIVVWLFDRSPEFDSLNNSIWYSLQTVTTVGYGDVVPTTVFGRIIGAVVMLFGIAFTAIVTAWITSTFVEAARRRNDLDSAQDEVDAFGGLHVRLDDLVARLEQIEARLIERGAEASEPPAAR